MPETSREKMPFKEIPNSASIILGDDYRKFMIEKGIKKAGSMRQLGRVMGYRGNAPNWSIKQILWGKQGIPFYRLKRLCEFLNITLDDVEKHVIQVR